MGGGRVSAIKISTSNFWAKLVRAVTFVYYELFFLEMSEINIMYFCRFWGKKKIIYKNLC